MRQAEVELKLPRFKMEEKYDLKDTLKSMGMVDAFDVTMSDFTGETQAINVEAAQLFQEHNVTKQTISEFQSVEGARTQRCHSKRLINKHNEYMKLDVIADLKCMVQQWILSSVTGMSPASNLVLSKVVHKAFLEVNEEGTEAAAATAAVVTERSIMIPDMFFADHPFLFFIRHNPTMSVLFAGRYCSPE